MPRNTHPSWACKCPSHPMRGDSHNTGVASPPFPGRLSTRREFQQCPLIFDFHSVSPFMVILSLSKGRTTDGRPFDRQRAIGIENKQGTVGVPESTRPDISTRPIGRRFSASPGVTRRWGRRPGPHRVPGRLPDQDPAGRLLSAATGAGLERSPRRFVRFPCRTALRAWRVAWILPTYP